MTVAKSWHPKIIETIRQNPNISCVEISEKLNSHKSPNSREISSILKGYSKIIEKTKEHPYTYKIRE